VELVELVQPVRVPVPVPVPTPMQVQGRRRRRTYPRWVVLVTGSS
jgi:hypothetical protein